MELRITIILTESRLFKNNENKNSETNSRMIFKDIAPKVKGHVITNENGRGDKRQTIKFTCHRNNLSYY